MDLQTGKMLNDFTSHFNDSYRCRASFGHAEAAVICGDEKGQVWSWDLLDVRQLLHQLCLLAHPTLQGKPLQPNPPPKVHEKVVTWIEHHPIEANEMITASADGTVKVWRNSN